MKLKSSREAERIYQDIRLQVIEWKRCLEDPAVPLKEKQRITQTLKRLQNFVGKRLKENGRKKC